MEKYKNRQNLQCDKTFDARFELPENELEARYGLPTKVNLCNRCVIQSAS